MKASRATAWLALGALLSCRVAPPSMSREAALRSVLLMLQEGRIEPAAEQLGRMRPAGPGDYELAQWKSVVAELLWRDDEAIRHQLAGVRRARTAGVDADLDAMLRGRLGDLLFQAGRYAEATTPLEVGAVGSESDRRTAFAAVSRLLPFSIRQSGPLLAEQPLIRSGLPEFVCSAGDLQRTFALDTGSSMTTLTRTLAAELGVRARRRAGFAVDSTGKEIPVEVGILGRFAVGGIRLGDIPVLVVGDRSLSLRDDRGGAEQVPAGVIGLDLLSAFRMTIDPERESVILEVPRGLSDVDSVQCVRSGGRCLLPVTIDNDRLWFALDTGASHSSLTPSGVARLSAGRRAVPSLRRVRGVGGGSLAVRELRGLVLRVSDARFRDVTLPVILREQDPLFPLHGVLGMDLLSKCRVTLDRGRARLRVQGRTASWQ